MAKITLFNRSTKKSGSVKIRFRISDGRDVQLYYKSGITADLEELSKFAPDGRHKTRVQFYNTKLEEEIVSRMVLVEKAYRTMKEENLPLTGTILEQEVEKLLHPNEQGLNAERNTLIGFFVDYAERNLRDGVFTAGRKKIVDVVIRELRRFLIINGLDGISLVRFNADHIMQFRSFLENEYEYVGKYPQLYAGLRYNCVPSKPRSVNTITQKLFTLQSFFTDSVNHQLIEYNPFHLLGKNRKEIAFKKIYEDEVIALSLDEIQAIREVKLTRSLIESRDAFLVHVTLGCRISDFQKLGINDLEIKHGVPFLHYVPQKTRRTGKEVETPILRSAFEILKRYNFKFKVSNAVSASGTYNDQLKRIFKKAGIDRKVKIRNLDSGKYEYKPIYELASSKVARKTYVTLMSRGQIDLYAAGLHTRGSEAIEHYNGLNIEDRFRLACASFKEDPYQVDESLNII